MKRVGAAVHVRDHRTNTCWVDRGRTGVIERLSCSNDRKGTCPVHTFSLAPRDRAIIEVADHARSDLADTLQLNPSRPIPSNLEAVPESVTAAPHRRHDP